MLNLDLATIVFQVINFTILAVLLNRFLFRPMLRNAEQRRAEREALLEELAEERRQAESLRAEQQLWQAQVEEQMQQARKEARERAEAERRELLREAREEAERVLVEAQTDAQRMTQQATNEFRQQLVDTVLAVSASVIGRVGPPEIHDALVAGLSERIQQMGRSEMQRVEALRHSLGEREPTAHIVSARELSIEQQGQLAQILTALADRRVSFELDTDPSLVAGLRVRLGDTMMDNSVAGRLQELKGQVLTALTDRVDDVQAST
jgi:F-type H+-transporting ATPase subunit b